MNLNIIADLEEKVNRAIDLIAGLKEDNKKIEEENKSLRHQLEDLRSEYNGYRKQMEKKIAETSGSRADFNGDEIKKRLLKLAGRLAALEDSWI